MTEENLVNICLGILIFVAVYIVYKIFTIPIIVAKCRGLSTNEVKLIRVLTWVGLLMGITWFIALFLSFLYSSKSK